MQSNVQHIGDAAEKALTNGKKRREEIDIKGDEKLKKYVDRIMKLKSELSDINGAVKGVYDEADSVGYDRTAIKFIVKMKTKELSDEFKQMVNQYCLDLGEPTVFRQSTN